MESLREFYKIGNGPSSSHTMGPEKAAKEFKKIIEKEYDKNNVEVLFLPEIVYDFHTNGLKFFAYSLEDNEMKHPLKEKLYFSVGGGSIVDGNEIPFC